MSEESKIAKNKMDFIEKFNKDHSDLKISIDRKTEHFRFMTGKLCRELVKFGEPMNSLKVVAERMAKKFEKKKDVSESLDDESREYLDRMRALSKGPDVETIKILEEDESAKNAMPANALIDREAGEKGIVQMRDWANSVEGRLDDRGQMFDQPDGEVVDTSLSNLLNAEPQKVQVVNEEKKVDPINEAMKRIEVAAAAKDNERRGRIMKQRIDESASDAAESAPSKSLKQRSREMADVMESEKRDSAYAKYKQANGGDGNAIRELHEAAFMKGSSFTKKYPEHWVSMDIANDNGKFQVFESEKRRTNYGEVYGQFGSRDEAKMFCQGARKAAQKMNESKSDPSPRRSRMDESESRVRSSTWRGYKIKRSGSGESEYWEILDDRGEHCSLADDESDAMSKIDDWHKAVEENPSECPADQNRMFKMYGNVNENTGSRRLVSALNEGREFTRNFPDHWAKLDIANDNGKFQVFESEKRRTNYGEVYTEFATLRDARAFCEGACMAA